MLTQELLDILWDFSNPEVSQDRFRQAILSDKYDDVEQAELATQLARALGLQGRFDEAKAILAEVAESHASQYPSVRVRLLLERGRVLNSSGHPALSSSVFERALSLADAAELVFLGVDAARMLAVVNPHHHERWILQAMEMARRADDPRTRRWGVVLHNKRGWHLHEAGDYWAALHEFRLAKICADECGTEDQRRTASWTVARGLRIVGRYADALDLQQRLFDDNPEDEDVQAELRKLRRAMADSTPDSAADREQSG